MLILLFEKTRRSSYSDDLNHATTSDRLIDIGKWDISIMLPSRFWTLGIVTPKVYFCIGNPGRNGDWDIGKWDIGKRGHGETGTLGNGGIGKLIESF